MPRNRDLPGKRLVTSCSAIRAPGPATGRAAVPARRPRPRVFGHGAFGQQGGQSVGLLAGVGGAGHVGGGIGTGVVPGGGMDAAGFLLAGGLFKDFGLDADGHRGAQGQGDAVRGAAVHADEARGTAQQEDGVVDVVPVVHDVHAGERAVEGLGHHEQQIMRQGAGQFLAVEHQRDGHGLHGADPEREQALAVVLPQDDDGFSCLRIEAQALHVHLYHGCPVASATRLCFLASTMRALTRRPVWSPAGRGTCTRAP